MNNEYENFAIVLARGGSKSIKNKNIKPIASSNCVEITIKNLFTILKPNQILLSSDSKEILKVGDYHKIRTLVRPNKYASDSASSESAWLHAIEFLQSNNIIPKTIIAPQVTSPLRYKNSLKNALNKFYKECYDSLFSAVKFSPHSFDWELDEKSNKIKAINYDPYIKRKLRQEQEDKVKIRENGSFFIFNKDGFLKFRNRLFGKIGYYLQDKVESIDIDETEDWIIAESILKSNKDKFLY